MAITRRRTKGKRNHSGGSKGAGGREQVEKRVIWQGGDEGNMRHRNLSPRRSFFTNQSPILAPLLNQEPGIPVLFHHQTRVRSVPHFLIPNNWDALDPLLSHPGICPSRPAGLYQDLVVRDPGILPHSGSGVISLSTVFPESRNPSPSTSPPQTQGCSPPGHLSKKQQELHRVEQRQKGRKNSPPRPPSVRR